MPNPDNVTPPDDYRYGFNGMEKDDEIGEGNYTTFYRAYDSRIARWISLDPVVHHNQSPYVAFDDNPIYYIDPSGADSENEEKKDLNDNEKKESSDNEVNETNAEKKSLFIYNEKGLDENYIDNEDTNWDKIDLSEFSSFKELENYVIENYEGVEIQNVVFAVHADGSEEVKFFDNYEVAGSDGFNSFFTTLSSKMVSPTSDLINDLSTGNIVVAACMAGGVVSLGEKLESVVGEQRVFLTQDKYLHLMPSSLSTNTQKGGAFNNYLYGGIQHPRGRIGTIYTSTKGRLPFRTGGNYNSKRGASYNVKLNKNGTIKINKFTLIDELKIEEYDKMFYQLYLIDKQFTNSFSKG